MTLVTSSTASERVVRYHDNVTAGGFELARKDLANVQIPLGGMNFEYQWNINTVTGHPTEQSIGSNAVQANFPTTDPLYLYLDDTDANGTSIGSFLDTIGTVSASILGSFRLYKKSDATEFIIFSITDADFLK